MQNSFVTCDRESLEIAKTTEDKGKMASMLELPRELYLMTCDYLSPSDLARLARVTKDHYLAVQQPLFKTIRINTFGNLVKLVHTITKPPIVSTISKKYVISTTSILEDARADSPVDSGFGGTALVMHSFASARSSDSIFSWMLDLKTPPKLLA